MSPATKTKRPGDADTLAASAAPLTSSAATLAAASAPTDTLAAPPSPAADTLAATTPPPDPGDEQVALTAAVARLAVAGRDDYLILGQFARGGIGRILRAHDPRLDRPVALKELLVHGRPVDEERFIREVLLTARLQHPGIVPVYAAGRWPSGEPFYAMKLVSGRSFDKVIAEATTLAARLALLPHVLVIAETIAYAHSQRILHRDLKPHNVLVGEFGETVVIDWGLAKELDAPDLPAPAPTPTTLQPAKDLTYVGAVVGTPGYMSPEQAGGAVVDERTDVYALGVILYHVLSGSLPFDATDAMNLVYKTVYEDPIPLRAREPDAPEELVAIVDKAMAKDPAARYPSAREFADDLRRFQTGQIVGAHRYTAWEHVRRFIRKRRAVLSLAALSLVVIVAVTAVSFARVAAERDAAEAARDDARDARAEAERRADNLSFEQARLLVEDDPPEALRLLASVSPQADWRRTRLIAADLAERGIPQALRGHRGAVSRAAFSPDGALLATTSDDCTLRVWDMSDRSSRAFYGHTDEVWRAAWSPDGARIATSSKDDTVRVWELATGAAQVLKSPASGVRNVAFSPDGRALYTADGSPAVRRWDFATGASEVVRERCGGNNTRWTDRFATCLDEQADTVVVIDLATGAPSEIPVGTPVGNASAVSPDGRWVVATTKPGDLWLWDRRGASGRLLPREGVASFSLREPRFSPASDQLVAPADYASVVLHDLVGGADRWLSPHAGYTRRGSFSADGALVVTAGGDSNVGVWHAPTRSLYHLPSARNLLIDAQVSPDGRWIAGVGNDPRVFLWAPDSFLRPQFTVSARAPVIAAAATLAGRFAALLAAGGLEVADTATLRLYARVDLPDTPYALAMTPDGRTVATFGSDDELVVWSLPAGERLLSHELSPETCPHSHMIADPAAPRFALLCRDGPVFWIDPAAPTPFVRIGETVGVTVALVVPGLRALVIGDQRGTLSVSDGPGAPLRTLDSYPGGIRELAPVPGAPAFILTSEEIVERRDLGDGPHTRYPGHRLQVGRVEVSGDGRWVVTVGRDSTIRVFDRATAALRIELFSSDLLANVTALSADGDRLAAVVNNGDVLVWDLRDGDDVARRGHRRLRVGAEIGALAFEPDGTLLVLTAEGVSRWRDDLPDDPDGLQRWLTARADLADPPKPQLGCAAPE